jgi:UDP-N-acetylmuramyl pentapeptide synthase
MAEVGDASEAAHAEIGAFAREKGIEEFWCAGEQMKAAAAAFGPAARHFETTQALQEAAIDAAKRPVSMLLKASNCMGFAKIVDALLQGA